jgi:hypothetical protein
MLTQNSTVDELFGIENKLDKLAIANKEQFKPLTRDTIRLNLIAKIDKELVENGSTIISKSNYDLSSITFGEVGVEYLNLDPILKVSDNIDSKFGLMLTTILSMRSIICLVSMIIQLH